ncbi:MAG: MiaB/RimO family radical SAM methylthiotransferase [Candidatus Shapirobacteria bacterium]
MIKNKLIYIKTFGCLQNQADSERISYYYWKQGYFVSNSWEEADRVVINTCMIRESAENRAYGLINKIDQFNANHNNKIEIIVTGCLVGALIRQNNQGEWSSKFPQVSKWLPISTYDYGENEPLRENSKTAIIPISNGCNNYCSYCIVPFTRGKEVSRPFEEIINEAQMAVKNGFEELSLVGQNVNSYGADMLGADNWVNMGKKRFKSLFPKLLETVATMGFKKISFVSSNPWDFSDELIDVVSKYSTIDRLIHLPLQSGDDNVLIKMNRGYNADEYLELVSKIKKKVKGVKISTDIIVGFPGEDETAFTNTIKVCRKAKFVKAYINKYSPRKGTMSALNFGDNVPPKEKKRRWMILEELINKVKQ